ncbi:MAG: hypothetical protein ACXWB7_08470, partial [Kaistella sp.]
GIIMFNFGPYLLNETLYLLNGKTVKLEVIDKKMISEQYVYEFIEMNSKADNKFESFPTAKHLELGQKLELRIAPPSKKVSFGKFYLASYLAGLFVLTISIGGFIVGFKKYFL